MISQELEKVFKNAFEYAFKNRYEFVNSEILIYFLLKSPDAKVFLEAAQMSKALQESYFEHLNADKKNKNVKALTKKPAKSEMIEQLLKAQIAAASETVSDEQVELFGGIEHWKPEMTLAMQRVLHRSSQQALAAGRHQTEVGHTLVALSEDSQSWVTWFLTEMGLNPLKIKMLFSQTQLQTRSNPSGNLPQTQGAKKSNVKTSASDPKEGDAAAHASESSSTGSATDTATDESSESALEMFCVNMTEKASKGHYHAFIGREDTLKRMVSVLARKSKNNPILVGEPGVGKTSLIEGLAQKIIQNDVPEFLKEKTIYSLDLGHLLAGTKFRGDFEDRIKKVTKELEERKNVIVFIDEIHNLVGAGSTSGGSMDASQMLKPLLQQGTVSFIGATTHQEMRQHFEKDKALLRRFQKIEVKPTNKEETKKILMGLRKDYENHHQVTYAEKTIDAILDLSEKYLAQKFWPDKAIDVMDEAGVQTRFIQKEVTVEIVEKTISLMTGLPPQSVQASENTLLKNLNENLRNEIYGQNESIEKVIKRIQLSRSGLDRQDRPQCSFILAGPTGVGKTEFCKRLAHHLGIHFARFDMSEYMEKHSLARLIGAPPGYVGYEQGGLLTETLSQHPRCVLLLDEIEKAHPDIFNILLQVMDAGRLTDGNNRLIEAQNCLLFMTSNAGAADMQRSQLGVVAQKADLNFKEAIRKTFSPEFLNRLDGVMTFHALDPRTIRSIALKFIEELRTSLASRKVTLEVSENAIQWLCEKGYEPAYGARPMARVISENMKEPLTQALLFEGLAVNGGLARFDTAENKIKLDVVPK